MNMIINSLSHPPGLILYFLQNSILYQVIMIDEQMCQTFTQIVVIVFMFSYLLQIATLY